MEDLEKPTISHFETDLVDMEELERLFKSAMGGGMDREVVCEFADEAMIAMSLMEAAPSLFRSTTPAKFVESTADHRAKLVARLER